VTEGERSLNGEMGWMSGVTYDRGKLDGIQSI
jgi:hypothetical protein